MFNSEIISLIAYLFFAAFLLAIGLFIWLKFSEEEEAHTLPCAIGFLLAAFYSFFMGIGIYARSDLAIVFGNLFAPLAWVFIYYAFANLLGANASLKTISLRALIGLAIIAAVLVLSRDMFDLQLPPLIFSSSSVLASLIFNSVIAFMCFKVYKRYQLSIAALLAVLHMFFSIVLIARVGLNDSYSLGIKYDANLFNPVFTSILFITSLAKFLGILSLFVAINFSRNQNLMVENFLIKEKIASKKIEQSEVQFLTSLNVLAKTRDNETGNHIIRTQHYAKLLALRLRSDGYYTESLSDKSIDLLFKATPLHDIGKVGIPDNILLKNGPLTDEEWIVMKTHTTLGEVILGSVEFERDGEADLVSVAIKIAGGHHEKWDGSGYPRGLAGEAIPLEARIMSLADMYDALVCKRVYKKAWTHEQAAREIISKRKSQFDPLVVDAFIASQDAFRVISEEYKDS
jgi:response regulator RpfG family c-di-GMP phosphodiesterase